ncbi:MAG: hypothetical protein DRJ03_08530 [Chloroflexi bacterium]|nr:MAG: hypothetical protein DRI81_04065 [Chloroflexota bacterium]RLC86529.1 MAG: hypothetical protein DRJ03_08530 [Chloroflexota bacterium]
MFAVTNSQGLAQAVQAGAYWVRFSAFHWDKIEPVRTEPPTYHWEVVDEDSLQSAAANGMEIIAIVQFTPDWAQKIGGAYCGPIKQDALDEFAQFLQALVSRYSAPPYNVRYWELGNEPDVDPSLVPANSVFGCWGDNSDEYYGGRYYAEMLKTAYPAIKAADPQARVLLGGLLLDRASGGSDTHPRFFEGILAGGGGPYFDIVSFHAYSYYGGSLGQMGNGNWPGAVTAVPEKVAFLRGVLEQYGYGGKALMNTESALLCSESTPDCLETQAIYIPRVYADALAVGLKGQVYFATINEGWRHTGLLLHDLTPKPAYWAYSAAASQLSGARYQEPPSYPGIKGYTFARDYRIVQVLWSADGARHTLTLPDDVLKVSDRYGNQLPVENGQVAIGISPVYLEIGR